MTAPLGAGAAVAPIAGTESPAPGHRSWRIQLARVVVAAVVVAVLMFPMYWMVRISLASPAELAALPVPLWPREWHLENYVEPWQQYPFARWFGNSVVVACVSVIPTVIINLCAGYAFAKLRFPGRNLLFLLILSTLMVPVQVIMAPQFQIVVELDLLSMLAG